MRTVGGVIGALAWGAILLGCGTTDAVDQVQVAPAEVVATGAASPLEIELGFPSDPVRRQYLLLTMQQEADATIVRCMQDAGFFYAVRSGVDAFRGGAFAGDGSRDWIETNGLGITAAFARALSPSEAAVVDPTASNLAFVSSLTPEEATAYDRALIGDQTNATTAAEYVPGGCWHDAFGDIVQVLSIVERFEPDLARLNERLTSDPRVMAFEQSWSMCMRESGYRYPSEASMVDDLYARLLAIDIAGSAPQAELDALLGYEREVALAGHDCNQGFAEELATIRYDYENEFLDDNRFVIAELLESDS